MEKAGLWALVSKRSEAGTNHSYGASLELNVFLHLLAVIITGNSPFPLTHHDWPLVKEDETLVCDPAVGLRAWQR